jgi:hypothetical protein
MLITFVVEKASLSRLKETITLQICTHFCILHYDAAEEVGIRAQTIAGHSAPPPLTQARAHTGGDPFSIYLFTIKHTLNAVTLRSAV